MTLSDFIRRYRTQALAAQALGVSQGMLSKILRGTDFLSLRQALRIHAEHGIPAATLVSAEDRALLESLIARRAPGEGAPISSEAAE